MKKLLQKVFVAFAIFVTIPPTFSILGNVSVVKATEQQKQTEHRPLEVIGRLQVILGDTDSLGRATSAHVQLKEEDLIHKKRDPKVTIDPVGWHNEKLEYKKKKKTKKAWLMHRGHLIGYSFSGLTDEKRNIVAMTAWLDEGNYKGVNPKNKDSLFYYEEKLKKWLSDNPDYWLDYKVTAIYQDKELLPRQIKLQYVGLDENGKKVEIQIGGKETINKNGITSVTLDNVSPNAVLNYADGTAVDPATAQKEKAKKEQEAKKAEEQRKAEEAKAAEENRIQSEAEQAVQNLENNQVTENVQPAQDTINKITNSEKKAELQHRIELVKGAIAHREAEQSAAEQAALQEQRTVYVARNGTAQVYWYDTANMPKNTRLDRVVSMTEAEAIAQGKRHTSKE